MSVPASAAIIVVANWGGPMLFEVQDGRAQFFHQRSPEVVRNIASIEVPVAIPARVDHTSSQDKVVAQRSLPGQFGEIINGDAEMFHHGTELYPFAVGNVVLK